MSAEAKVGVFFLLAILLIGIVALFMGDFWTRARSYIVTAYFENAQGLAPGAEVRLAGVKIGRVLTVSLAYHPKFPRHPAAVRMAIQRDVSVYQSDQFIVKQGALLGDKYVEVVRTEATPKQPLTPGGAVAGASSESLEDITREARAVLQEARLALGQMRALFATQYNAQAIRAILTNMMSATGKADKLASQALQIARLLAMEAKRAGPKLTQMADNLAKASASVKLTADLVQRVVMSSPIPRDVARATENLKKMTEDLAAISESFAEALATPETRQKLQSALDNLHETTVHLAQTSAQAEKLLDENVQADLKEALRQLREAATHIAKITATYDEVLTDPKFTQDLQATLAAARETTETSARAMAKAEKSLEDVDRTLRGLSRMARTAAPEEVRVRGTLEAKNGGARTDAEIDLVYGENPHNFWRIGIRDVGDTNGLTLQRSLPSGKNRWRLGLFGGQPGVGFDLNPQGELFWEAELWKPSDPHLDLRGGYKVAPRVDMLFGIGDIGGENEPFVGVRYRSWK